MHVAIPRGSLSKRGVYPNLDAAVFRASDCRDIFRALPNLPDGVSRVTYKLPSSLGE